MQKIFQAISVVSAAVLNPTASAETADQCFGRTYTDRHLAEHPDQLVTSMKLLVRFNAPSVNGQTLWGMSATTRGRRETLFAIGLCHKDPPSDGHDLSCFAECDTGDFRVKYRGEKSLLLSLGRMHFSSDCGDGPREVMIEGGVDDKLFRLDRLPATACKGLDEVRGVEGNE